MSEATVADRDDARGPHVLHVADREVFVRFGAMLRQLFLGLGDADVTVSVLTDDADSARRFVPPTATAHVVTSLSGWRSWRLAAKLGECISEAPTLAHCWGVRAATSIERWAQHHGVPLLIHALSTADVLTLNRRGPRTDQYVAGACDSLCRALGVRRPVSHYPVQRLTPGILVPDEDEPARHSHNTLGVVWLGQIAAGSGLDTLIDAVARLQQQRREIQLVIIGRGPHETRIRGTIQSRGLQDRVSVINDVGVWDNVMAGIDVCVVPARQQELSLGPLMAMALAKTVVASRDQIAEWFVEDSTAWMFNPGSATELAECLARADSCRAEAELLGRQARDWVRQRHKMSRLIAETAAFYSSVAYPRKTVAFRQSRGRI